MPYEKHIFTVSELTKQIKRLLETSFGCLWVTGELSNVRQPSSGHYYFTIKDDSSQIRCVMFRQQAAALQCRLQDGMQAVIFARLSVYDRDGNYQLYAEIVEPKGKGSLQLAFEQLKVRLQQEGLFDESRKKPLPFLPGAIGIITSPTGAVIRDMLHVLEKRFNNCPVIIYPVKVQGQGAKEEVAQALDYFNERRNVDVIVVARGGGSIEDLWVFNEEVVARAIAASTIPVISAIGHETDFTIADFVSDLRAPTPSRAAELVVPRKQDLIENIESLISDLQGALKDLIPQQQQRIDDLLQGLQRAAEGIFSEKKNELELQLSKLAMLNPLAILARGYSITSTAAEGVAITDSRRLKAGERLKTRFHRGEVMSIIEEKHDDI